MLPVRVDLTDLEGFARAVKIADEAIATEQLNQAIIEANEAFGGEAAQS